MAVLHATKVRNSLIKKGFVPDEGDHYNYHYLNDQGKKTVAWTKVSRGAGDIDNYLIGKMAKQTQLSKGQFLDLINCSLSKEQYKEILRAKGIL